MAQVIEIDAATGEVIERDYSAAEKQQRKADEAAAAKAAQEQAAADALRESARLKIAESSGLTPEEMTALGF